MIISTINKVAPEPSYDDILQAAFRQSNILGSTYGYPQWRTLQPKVDPSYSYREFIPEDLKEYQELYAWTTNPDQANNLTLRLRKELEDKQTLAEGGIGGLVTELFAAALSPEQYPLYFIPGGNIVKASSILRGAAKGAALAGTSVAASEAFLQSTLETRTAEESAYAIGGSLILGGLGGSIAAHAETRAALKRLDYEMAQVDSKPKITKATPLKDPTGQWTPEYVFEAEKAVDNLIKQGKIKPEMRSQAIEQTLQLFAKHDNRLKYPKLYKALGKFNPVVRGLTRRSRRAREVTANLFSTPLAVGRNSEGVAHMAVDVKIEQLIDETNNITETIINDGYKTYRDKGGDLSLKDFADQIGLAMADGGKHSNPIIAKTAKEMGNSFNPYLEKFADSGVLRHMYEGWDDLTIYDAADAGLSDEVIDKAFTPVKRRKGKIVAGRKPRANIADILSTNDVERLIEHGKLSRVIKISEGDSGFFPRIFNPNKVRANKEGFMGILKNSMRREFKDYLARRAEPLVKLETEIENRLAKLKTKKLPPGRTPEELKALRVKAKGRLPNRSPEQIVADKMVELELRKQRLAEYEKQFEIDLERAAEEIYHSVVNGNYKSGYRLKQFKSGPFKRRIFDLSAKELYPFLDTDPRRVMSRFMRNIAPKHFLTETFGDSELRFAAELVSADYDKMAARAASTKERVAIEKERNEVLRDMQDAVDVLRRRYGRPSNPDSLFYKSSSLLRDFNVVTKLGSVVVSSIPDIGTVLMRHLGRVFKFAPIAFSKESRAAAKKIGLAADLVNSRRVAALAHMDPDEYLLPSSKLDRFRAAAMQKFMTVTGMNLWNSSLKSFVGGVYFQDLVEAAHKFKAGKLSPKDVERFAVAGLSKEDLLAIANKLPPGQVDTAGLPEDLAARMAQAVYKEAEISIVTPGAGDLPFVSRSVLGKVIFQFKSFALASNHKILLSTIDDFTAQKMIGLLITLFLGGVSFAAKQAIKGKEIPEDPDKWIRASIEQSGVLGIWMDVNNTLEAIYPDASLWKLAGIEDAEPVRRFGYDNTLAAMLGPWVSTTRDMQTVIRAFGSGTVTEKDARAFRRLIPLNNHFLLYRGLNQIERAIVE